MADNEEKPKSPLGEIVNAQNVQIDWSKVQNASGFGSYKHWITGSLSPENQPIRTELSTSPDSQPQNEEDDEPLGEPLNTWISHTAPDMDEVVERTALSGSYYVKWDEKLFRKNNGLPQSSEPEQENLNGWEFFIDSRKKGGIDPFYKLIACNKNNTYLINAVGISYNQSKNYPPTSIKASAVFVPITLEQALARLNGEEAINRLLGNFCIKRGKRNQAPISDEDKNKILNLLKEKRAFNEDSAHMPEDFELVCICNQLTFAGVIYQYGGRYFLKKEKEVDNSVKNPDTKKVVKKPKKDKTHAISKDSEFKKKTPDDDWVF